MREGGQNGKRTGLCFGGWEKVLRTGSDSVIWMLLMIVILYNTVDAWVKGTYIGFHGSNADRGKALFVLRFHYNVIMHPILPLERA